MSIRSSWRRRSKGGALSNTHRCSVLPSQPALTPRTTHFTKSRVTSSLREKGSTPSTRGSIWVETARASGSLTSRPPGANTRILSVSRMDMIHGASHGDPEHGTAVLGVIVGKDNDRGVWGSPQLPRVFYPPRSPARMRTEITGSTRKATPYSPRSTSFGSVTCCSSSCRERATFPTSTRPSTTM